MGRTYNLQCRENGKPVSRYVPQDQVEMVKQNTENYRTFQALVDRYAQEIIAQTRKERLEGKNKARGLSPVSRARTPGVDGSVSVATGARVKRFRDSRD